ncbi:MAG: hypothetical protein P1V20_25270 [Verrucomicrobiales bacterium]|nr:hypothetical protein [Verrucomicrobiales bacterium]
MKKLREHKRKIGCLSIVVIMFLALYVGNTLMNEKWIEESTGFEIPFFRKSFRTNSQDVGLGAFLKVSPGKAERLIAENDFGRCDHDPNSSIWGGLFEVRRIRVDPFPPQEQLMLLKGASKWKSWGIYAHQSTGRFWIVVLHPDMAGDPPPGALGE